MYMCVACLFFPSNLSLSINGGCSLHLNGSLKRLSQMVVVLG